QLDKKIVIDVDGRRFADRAMLTIDSRFRTLEFGAQLLGLASAPDFFERLTREIAKRLTCPGEAWKNVAVREDRQSVPRPPANHLSARRREQIDRSCLIAHEAA